jgi:cytochrome c oxidase subunit 3
MGAVNTVVLLFSSLTAALAVRQAQVGDRKGVTTLARITILCAGIFFVVKFFEYSAKFEHGLLPGRYFTGAPAPATRSSAARAPSPTRRSMFFALYFMMTGLHGLHVLIGMGVLGWVLMRNPRTVHPRYFTAVEIGALYWHLVDLVWIYLFPLLYLVG